MANAKKINEIKIVMLGASGTGKTSLLTAMYDQFAATIGETNLQLTPDLKTSAILTEKLGDLKSLLRTPDVEPGGGLAASDDPMSYLFDLGNKGAKPSIRLNFQDFLGGYLNANAPEQDQNFVQDKISESEVIIIAIDTPTLMENRGQWNEKFNRPLQITNYFQRAFKEMNAPRLVIFVPIKCEKYMQNEQSAKDLLNRVKESYSLLFNFFNNDAIRPWVTTVVTPIQTVGTVSFSYIEEIDGQPHFHFKRMTPDAVYSPKDSEQPLRYLLRFALKLQLKNAQYHWGPFNFVRDWLKWDDHLKKASREAAKGCKINNGFAILNGEQWLNIE
jgi:GTPase SAR1 family protein